MLKKGDRHLFRQDKFSNLRYSWRRKRLSVPFFQHPSNMRVSLLLFLVCCPAWAQRTLEYDESVVKQIRIDLRDLGYPPVDVIPSDESAIRSLTVAPNGAIYGATSGRRSHLFVLDPRHGWVQPLGYLKEVTTVHRSLVAD